MKNMTIGLLAVAALGIEIGESALAADMSFRVPPRVAPAPISTWTGFYIGGNFGYSASDSKSSSAHLADGTGIEQMQTNFSLAPSGWIGGGQVGYNWQFVPHWVLGAEWDWQGADQRDSACGVAGMACSNTPSPNGTSFVDQKLDWISTLRARIGWAQDMWLFYATGGGAWGKADTSLSVNCPAGCGNLGGPSSGAGAFSDTKSGWVFGGGIEVMFAPGWSAKVEYLHADLGSISHTITTAPVLTSVRLDDRLNDNIFRVGVNYKLSGGY